MKTTSKEPGRFARILGFLGIGLCALCCALPMIGIIGGAGILTGIAVYAEKIAVVLLILSATFFAFWFYRKRQAAACSIDCACKEDASNKIETKKI